jgi:hypothetical protein
MRIREVTSTATMMRFGFFARSACSASMVAFSWVQYSSNEVGLGWTNGVFKVQLDELRPVDRRRVLGGDSSINGLIVLRG